MDLHLVITIASAAATWLAAIYAIRKFRDERSESEVERLKLELKSAVRISILEMRADISDGIAKDYRTIPLCVDQMRAYSERMNSIESKLNDLRGYTHKWKHVLVNVITGVIMSAHSTLPPDHPFRSILMDAAAAMRDA